MSLRKKTLFIIGITLVSLIALLSIISKLVLLESFAQLEENQTRRNIERIKAAVAIQIARLDTIAGDWSPWDDTYSFMQDRNSQYIEGNLNDATLVNLGINFMLFIDLSGQVVFSKAVDLSSQTEAPISPTLLEHLKQNQFILQHSGPDSTISGIILLPDGAVLFASRPILTSNFGGPARGTLVVGRYLDEAFLEALAETTLATITIQLLNTPITSSDFQLAQNTLTSPEAIFLQPLNQDALAGYLLFNDVYEQPAFILRVTIPRSIYQQGQASVSFFVGLLIVTGLVFGLVTFWLLERGVLARLTQLSYQVNQIGGSGNPSERVTVTGTDELTSLGTEINKMLTVLGQSQQALQESEKSLEQQVASRTAQLTEEIAEREQIEESLREREELFRALFESSPDAVILIDPASSLIIDCNEVACRLNGYSRAELIGQPIHMLDATDPHGEDTTYLKRVQAAGAARLETLHRRKDGTVFPLEVSTSLITFKDRQILLGIDRDITERLRAQAALAQARDQALEASRLKSEILAKVSHELRTPLAAILGFAEMLELGVYGPLTPEQDGIMAEIIDSSNFLNGLVNELLDQAQLDAGRLMLNISTFVPQIMIDEMLAKMNVLAQNKGLTLTTEIASDLPAQLSGDLTRLQQILINLVHNAIKFTPHGAVTVRLLRPDVGHWAIQVADTGIGIPAEAQAYIFEPFRQVDGSLTRRYEGSGLGLSIVKQLAELMAGHVTLESQASRGSTFTVILPL